MASPKNKTAARRQSSQRRLPSRHARAKNKYLQYIFFYSIPFLHLRIALRNFSTTKVRSEKELVLRFNRFKFKELAIERFRPELPETKPYKLPKLELPRLSWRWQNAAIASTFIIVGLAGGVYSLTHLQTHKSIDLSQGPSSAKVLAVQTPPTKVMPRSIPSELIIPKIGVDTTLAQTGLDQYGAVAMPFDIYTASWYEYSPTPGELGPAVIVGHLDGANYANLTGIFWRINELVPGDQVAINRADGSTANFKVIAVKQVSRANFPTAEIYGNINYAGLRLITCGGTFDPVSGHYDKNTVVFAALE